MLMVIVKKIKLGLKLNIPIVMLPYNCNGLTIFIITSGLLLHDLILMN